MNNPANQATSHYLNRHLVEIDEPYSMHLRFALGFAGQLFIASIACFIHALCPFLCEKTGSRYITHLHQRMVTHRQSLKFADTEKAQQPCQ